MVEFAWIALSVCGGLGLLCLGIIAISSMRTADALEKLVEKLNERT